MAALSSTETAATMTRAGSSTFIYGPTAKDINETSEGRGRKIDISAGKCLKELESTWRTLAGAPIRGCAAPAGEKLRDISALLEACAGVTLPNSSNTIADVLGGSVTLVTWLNEQARDLHYPVMQNTAKGKSVEAQLPYGGTAMAFEPGGDASDPENLYDVSKYNSNARVYGAGAPPAPQDTAYEDALRIALLQVPGSGMQFKRLRDPPTGWMLGKCNNEDGRYSPTTSGNAMPGFGDPDAFARSAEWEEHFTPEYDEDGDEVAAEVYGLTAFQKTEMSTEASQYYCRLLGIPFSFDDTLEGDTVRNNMRVMVRHWINFLRTAIKVYDDIDRYLYQRVTTRYPQLVKQGGGVPSYSSRPRGPFGNKVLPYIAYRVDVAVPTEPIGEVKDGSRRPNPKKMGVAAMAPLSAKMATRVAYGDVVPSAAVHAFQVLLQKCFASPKTVQAAVVRGLDRAKPYGYNGGFTEALGSFREVIGYCSMLSRMPAAPAAAAPLLTYTEEVLMLLKTFGTPPTMGGGQNAGGQKKAWAVSALLDEAKEKINAGDAPQRADMEALYGQLDALGAGADGSGQKDEEEVMFDFNKRSGGPAVAVNQVTWADGAEPTPFENPNYMQPPSSGGGKKGGDREKVRDRASSVRSGGPPLGVIGNVVGEAFHPSSFNPKLREMARATQRRRDMAVPLSRGTGQPGGPRLPSYGGGRGGPPPRSGDWRCPRCDVNNFGYRKVCFKCGTSAPPKGAAGARAPALQLQANKVGWEASGGSWLDAFEEDDGMWGGGVGRRSDDVGGGSSWGVQNDDRGYSNHEVALGARKKAEELAHLRAQFEACASRLAEVDDYEWSALAAADDAGAAGESLGVAAMHVGEEPEHVAYLRNELRPIMGEVDLDCESGPTPMARSRYYGAEWVPVDEVLAAEHEISIRSVHVPPPPPTAESGTASEVFDFAGEDEQEPSSLSFRVVDFPGFTRTVTFERNDEDAGWADDAAGGGWGDGIDEADTRGVLSSTASLAAAAAPAGPSPVSPLSLRPSQTHPTGASIIDPDAEKVEEGGGGEDGGDWWSVAEASDDIDALWGLLSPGRSTPAGDEDVEPAMEQWSAEAVQRLMRQAKEEVAGKAKALEAAALVVQSWVRMRRAGRAAAALSIQWERAAGLVQPLVQRWLQRVVRPRRRGEAAKALEAAALVVQSRVRARRAGRGVAASCGGLQEHGGSVSDHFGNRRDAGIDEADTRGVLSSSASLAAAAAPAGPSPVSPLSLRPSQTHPTGASIIDPDAEKVEEGGGGEDGGVGGRAAGPSLHAVSWGELDAGVGLSRGRPYNRSFDPGVAHDCSGGLQAICVNAVRMRQGRPPPSAGGGPGGQRKASVAKTAQVDGGAGASVVGGEYLSLLHAVASCSLPLTVAGGAAHTVTAKGLLVAVTRQRVSIVQPVYVVPAWTDCLLGQDAFAKRVEDNTGDEPSYGVARYSVPPNAKVNFTVVGANRGGSGVGVKMMLPLMVLAPGSPQAAVLMAVSAARRVYGSAGALRAVSGLVVRPVRVGSGAVNGVRGLESHVVKQTLQEFHENNLHKDPRTLLAEYDARRHPGVLLTTRTMPPCVPCALVNIRERATNARSDGLPYHSVGVAPPGSIAIVDQMGPFTTAAARGTDGKFKVSIVPGVASLATQANLIVCGSTNDPSVQLMQSTAEVGQKLIEYCEEGKAMGQPVRVIIADAATVHKSTKLQGHCKANQIELVVLTKGMHEAVGQAEALVRTSKLAMKAIMLAKRCHVTEWELAIRAVVMRKRVMYTRGAAVVPFVKRFGGSLHIDRHYAAEPMGLVVVLREQDKGTPGNLDVKSMLARFIGYDQRRLCFLVFVYKTAKLEYVKTIKAFKGGQAELALSGRYAHSADMGPLASGVAYFEELGEAVKAGAAVSAGGPVPTAAMVGPVAPKIVVPRTLPTAFDKAKTAVAAARGGAMEAMRPAEHRLDAAARAASGSAASVVSAPPPPPNVDLGAPRGGGLARYRAEVAETEENFRKLQEHWSQAAKLATEERAGAVATAAQEMIRSEAAEASAAAAERAAAEAALQKTQQALKACDPLLAGGAAAEATAQPPGRAAAEVDGEAPAAPRPAQGAEDVVPPYDDYVGRQVRKKFDGYGTFLGTVESVKGAVRPYFTVRYDDGDEEQVTKGELKLILVPLGVASATVPMVANGPPVKRQVGWVLPGSGMSSGDATTDASRRAGEAAMEETSVRRGRMRAGEWRKWWNPSDKSPMVELVERNAPVAYRDGGGAECEKRNGRGGAHQLEYDKYKSAKTLQEAVRLGAGPYLAADAAAKRMAVVVGDGSGVPLVDDYSDVGGPRVLNEEEDLAEAAGVGVARVGEPVLDVAAVRPAAPAGVAALPAAPGGAGAMPSRAAAEMAEAGFRPYEALAPTSFGRVVSPHKGEVSRRSWVPKNWNDRERDGEVNADQEVWDVADVDEAVMFRKMGAVRTASVTEAEAEGAFKSTYMVHREKQLKSTGTGADYKVSTKYKTRFCARGDRDKFQVDYWAKSANTLRVEDMQLFFAQAMSGEDGQLTCLDFSSAHLQAPIDPDVKKTYVDIPPCDPDYGKVGEDGKPMVWLVIGGFYGKVPMPRMWEQWLAQYLRSRGAVRLSHSKCIWTWTSATGSGERMMAMIHADDKMIWTTDTVGGRAERDLFIAAGFAVKETGGYDENGRLQALFVGFDVVHQKGGCGGVPPGEGYIHVCAETQIDALVTAFGFAEANTSEVPYPAGYQLSLDPDETKDDSEFARCAPVLVGSLLYIKNVRPDIDAQRHNMQRKTAMGFNPKDTAMGKAVLRYLHGSRRRGLRWGGKMAATMRNKLYLYADSSYKPEWGNCSALCVIPMLNGGPVGAWVAKAPNWVDSPNAGEMCALHQACRKAVTLRHALGEYGLYQPGPSVVLEDNAAAIGQAAANGGLKNARHLQGCVNLVTEMQEGGKVVVKKVDGERNPADLGTKPVQKAGLHKVLREMIMYDG